jgi:hypothetical protein
MKTFKVYKHSEGYAAVKVGISWPAFFLNWVWMFYKNLLPNGILFLYLSFLVITKSAGIDVPYEEYTTQETISEIVGLIIAFVPLFKGNEWVEKRYVKKGYMLVKSIQADNLKAAIALTENDDLEK